ncbi:iron-containing alcohol dehydrogenase [Bosea sp. (in: a-proteobacteria)]|uniref:iron-containing alcohol dehydrogenase n=1 Tax=Bosea sp. (in: a-proteobacteria) TaxID=1871050 RepID=UPI0033425E55
MISFRLNNPTEILFGAGQIAGLATLVPAGARVLLLYGGGSIKANGVHDQVTKALSHVEVVEFGGIEPNPVYETIMKAAALVREKGCNWVLGVGGGSVVDAAKFLAYVVPLDVTDPWEHLARGGAVTTILPVGAVLTLPATGSESNPVSVISNKSRHLKLPFAQDGARPRFAVLDPTTMASLSRRQLENGAVDAFTHVIEQYLTLPVNAPVQFGFSETILRVLIEWGPVLVEKNTPEARENVMWAANQALNGLIGSGVPQDWSTHMIGHALTALYDIDHARTLSMVMPSLLRHKAADKLPMLVRYARNVWGIEEEDEAVAAEKAIAATADFFARMGCPIRTSDMAEVDIEAVVSHIAEAGQLPLGEDKDIDADAIRAILREAA